ncbi:GNAT family N-acetyltransferase [Cupriavidus sp. BIC8F]|uniref:GNAT family N-acetyltransferase n=1 Tax=Cupriavidus sp. BIC8F TaxID=3079014 RepID=UPI0029166615|nr:GNAT family N-acetyltransferase [Cupriavidus sp. BIC8F]
MARHLQFRAAQGTDWRAISQVLDSCGLPSDHVALSSRCFHIAVLDEAIVGCACAERHGQTVVVRSVAVLREYSDRQIAAPLVGALLSRARAEGCTKAVVVTAAEYRPLVAEDPPLATVDSMPEEIRLSPKLLRRSGARSHGAWRHTD